MFFKTSIKVPPKVTAALDLFYQLRYGTRYDSHYGCPLRSVSANDLPKEFAEPVQINGKDGAILTNPREALQGFSIDYCSWFEDRDKDYETSDPLKYDGISNWYVSLWNNHHTSVQFDSMRETIAVGITQLPKQPPRVNSYSLSLGPWNAKKGHGTILLPSLHTAAGLRVVK